jgi:hypothetical protein
MKPQVLQFLSVDEELDTCDRIWVERIWKYTPFSPWQFHHLIGFMVLLSSKAQMSAKSSNPATKQANSSLTYVCWEYVNNL